MNNWSYNPAWLLAAIMLVLAAYCWVQLPGKDAQFLIAVRQNSTNSIQALVIKGADVNARAKGKGATALMIAAGHGNQEAVDLLLKVGARKDVEDTSGKTALDYALGRGRTNAASLH